MLKRLLWLLLALGMPLITLANPDPPPAVNQQAIQNILLHVHLMPAPGGIVMQAQNQGSILATRGGGLFVINCTTNTTCVWSGNTLSISASSTASTAWSGITAATNANVGTFIQSGNAWDFSGASSLKVVTGAALAPTTSGLIGYDSTNNKWVFGQNAATVSFGLASSSACAAHNFVSTPAFATALAICTQPAFADLASTPTTLSGYGITNGVTNTTTVNGHALSGNVTVAFTDIGGSITASQMLPLATNDIYIGSAGGQPAAVAMSGDCSILASGAITCAKVNGNSVPSGAAANQVAVGTAASTLAWETITDCNGSSNALNFTQATHLFSCNNIATLSNPMTTLGDMITGGAAGAVSRLAGPSSPNNLPYTLLSIPSAGAAAAPIWSLAGVPVNSQSGAGYTLLATDRANYLSLSNASAQTLTLPAISGNFASNLPFVTQNIGNGAWTISPTTQTINGSSSDLLSSKFAAFVYQDSSPNWFSINFPTANAFPNCQDSSGNHLNWNSTTRVFSCGTSTSGGTFYQTVDANGTGQTQRPTLNLISGTNATVSCVDNAGSTRTDCTVSASTSAGSRLDQITAATAGNTINNTTNAQVWNCAPTGSLLCMTFGENTAATGSGNIILDAQTLAASTASPFTATARGTANGIQVNSTGTLAAIGTGHNSADQINGTSFSGTLNDIVGYGAGGNIPLDTGILYTNVVVKNAANTYSSGLQNFNSATMNVPSSAAYAPTTASLFGYDSTNNRLVVGNGTNTSIPTWITAAPTSLDLAEYNGTLGKLDDSSIATANVVTAASNYTNGNLVQAAGANKTTSDSGVVAANVVTATSAAAVAKQVCVSGGATKTCSYIDFPQVLDIPAANCNNTTAGAGWSIGSGGTVTCRTGTNNKGGYIAITDTSTTFATFQIAIPEDWDTASNPYIRFQLASTDTTSGHTIIPSIQVACYKGDGSTTDDVAANAAHSLSTTTLNTTANQFWSSSNVQMNSTDVTGCVAGGLMQITVGRATDTATNAEFYSATLTFPRLIAVQAN